MPGRLTSKVYFARPLTLSEPSSRLTRVPTTDRGVAGQLYFGSTGGCCGAPPRPAPAGGCWVFAGGCCSPPVASATGGLTTPPSLHAGHRFEDAVERPAAADVAVEPFP